MLMAIKIDHNKCKWTPDGCDCDCGCANDEECKCCAEVCPVEAITREDIVKINDSKCTECGICVETCPFGAISIISS